MLTISVILNRHSGTLRQADLELLEQRLRDVLCAPRFEILRVHRSDRPIDDQLEQVAKDASDCILVVGGDGSVSAAAATAWRTGKVLAVLPGGTMNLYARTLGMPLDLDDSIDALAKASVQAADIATINDQPFVHQFTTGMHAEAVRLRQSSRYGTRFGKLLATVRAFALVLLRPTVFRAELDADSFDHERRRLSALSVSNNVFGEGHIPYADDPVGGELGVYCSEPLNFFKAVKLTTAIMLGAYDRAESIELRSASRVQVRFPIRWRRRYALIDGEPVRLGRMNTVVMHAGALRVLKPEVASGD